MVLILATLSQVIIFQSEEQHKNTTETYLSQVIILQSEEQHKNTTGTYVLEANSPAAKRGNLTRWSIVFFLVSFES